jgi:DMSO/TMAO reductase YedYZ molybdopterin-dependent catalytic subunit
MTVSRRKFMRLAAAGLSSALAPLGGCAQPIGQQRGTSHFPIPSRPLTPTESWYWMAIQGSYETDLASYRLKIGGVADRALELSVPTLRAELEAVEQRVTLACVGNKPNGRLMSSAWFRGARMRDLAALAQVSERASGAFITGLDGFVSYQAIGDLLRDESIIAYDMSDERNTLEPLPIDHGFPCRILTPGLYGYMQPKWIDSITFTDQGGYQSVVTRSIPYFSGKMQLASGFSQPRSGPIPAGEQDVLGFAFGDGREIVRVELQIDDGPWQPAEIVYNDRSDALPAYLWTLWRFRWDPSPGVHRLRCRAYYPGGETQLDGMRFPYSGGSIASLALSVQQGGGS